MSVGEYFFIKDGNFSGNENCSSAASPHIALKPILFQFESEQSGHPSVKSIHLMRNTINHS